LQGSFAAALQAVMPSRAEGAAVNRIGEQRQQFLVGLFVQMLLKIA
jgi:hypothetical protein